MSTKVLAIVAALVAPQLLRAQVHSFRLENDIRVIVNPIAEATDIAMETVYDVGFIHEPENLPQASHLLEHLVCYSPVAGWGDREAMGFLNRVGSGNAETLPALTHYDSVVPKRDFPTAVRIEADRLRQFSVDRRILEREAKRCYQEMDFVEANPQAGLLKHAFMACSHAWRFQSPRTMLRSGMEAFRSEDLQAFHARFYNPRNLTISISGAISVDEARKLLTAELGTIDSPDADPVRLDWSRVPRRHTVRWDARARGVCIAWSPPEAVPERTALSVLGLHAMRSLVTDADVQSNCDHVSCSNTIWPVGELPLFVYASLKETADLADVERLLMARFEAALNEGAAEAAVLAPALRSQARKATTWAELQQASTSLTRMGRKKQEAERLYLLQDALNRVMLWKMLGWESAPNVDPASLEVAELHQLIRRTTSMESARVVTILPMEAGRKGPAK